MSQIRYDGFLSYAHEDEETVSWLNKILSSYWVPGKKQRRIFQDKRRITAGSLDQQIIEALAESRYLIVCWSDHVLSSPWVKYEVSQFLELRTAEHVLVCRTGGGLSSDAATIPDFLHDLVADTEDGSHFIPDLRGSPAQARGKKKREFIDSALALLAPLVGLKDKEEVLGRRQKRLWAAAVFCAILLGIAVAIWGTWRWWLTTPPGLFHEVSRRVVEASSNQEINELGVLFPTARAFGRLNRRDLLEDTAGFLSPSFRPLYLAIGYAALPEPDCRNAEEAINDDEYGYLTTWPDPLLIMAKRCDEKWLEAAFPSEAQGTKLLSRASLLAKYGFPDRAQEILSQIDGSNGEITRDDVMDVYIELVIHRKGKAVEIPAWVHDWSENLSDYDMLWQCSSWLRSLDYHGLLGTPLARDLLFMGVQAAQNLEDDFLNSWELKQQMIAYLVNGDDLPEARAVLEATAPDTGKVLRPDFYDTEAVGWAWRGLAYHRLGEPESADDCFSKAEECAHRPRLQSRTWGEWKEMAVIYALAGEWQRAFRCAEEPLDELTRILHRLHLIELWVDKWAGGVGGHAPAGQLDEALAVRWRRRQPQAR